jgi:hypothetical protein
VKLRTFIKEVFDFFGFDSSFGYELCKNVNWTKKIFLEKVAKSSYKISFQHKSEGMMCFNLFVLKFQASNIFKYIILLLFAVGGSRSGYESASSLSIQIRPF